MPERLTCCQGGEAVRVGLHERGGHGCRPEGVAMRRMFWVCVLSASIVVLAIPAASQAAYSGANGRLAWEGYPIGGGTDSEILSANPDGSGLTALTTNTVDDRDPAWSPDGKQIAF